MVGVEDTPVNLCGVRIDQSGFLREQQTEVLTCVVSHPVRHVYRSSKYPVLMGHTIEGVQ